MKHYTERRKRTVEQQIRELQSGIQAMRRERDMRLLMQQTRQQVRDVPNVVMLRFPLIGAAA